MARHPRYVPGDEVFDAQSEVTPFSFPQRDTRRRFTARSRPEEGGSIAYAALSVCGSGSRICDAVFPSLTAKPSALYKAMAGGVTRVGVKKGCLAPSEHLRRDGGSQLSRVATAVAIGMRAHCTHLNKPAQFHAFACHRDQLVCSRFKRAWARQFGKRARLVSIRRPESLDPLPEAIRTARSVTTRQLPFPTLLQLLPMFILH